MNIKQFTRLFTTAIDVNTSVLISGNHGIAKSAVCRIVGLLGAQQDAMRMHGLTVADLATHQITPHGFVDRRLAIDEVPDLRGMMYNLGGRTVWATPDWFPLHDDEIAKLSKDMEAMGLTYHAPEFPEFGVLLLDEIGQASPEVQKAAFELVLDRTLAGRKIAPGWRIIAANNSNTKLYGTATFSPAFMDRWFALDLFPSQEEFFEWGNCAEGTNPQYLQDLFTPDVKSKAYKAAAAAIQNRRNIYPAVTEYLNKYPEHLDMADETIQVYGMNNRKGYSRRSWEKFSKSLYRAHQSYLDGFLKDDILEPSMAGDLISLAAGHLGSAVALQFQDFIAKDGDILTSKVLWEKWGKGKDKDQTVLEAKVKGTDAAGLAAVLDGVGKMINNELGKAKPADMGQAKYASTIDFCRSMVKFLAKEGMPALAVQFFRGLGADANKLIAYDRTKNTPEADAFDPMIFACIRKGK